MDDVGPPAEVGSSKHADDVDVGEAFPRILIQSGGNYDDEFMEVWIYDSFNRGAVAAITIDTTTFRDKLTLSQAMTCQLLCADLGIDVTII